MFHTTHDFSLLLGDDSGRIVLPTPPADPGTLLLPSVLWRADFGLAVETPTLVGGGGSSAPAAPAISGLDLVFDFDFGALAAGAFPASVASQAGSAASAAVAVGQGAPTIGTVTGARRGVLFNGSTDRLAVTNVLATLLPVNPDAEFLVAVVGRVADARHRRLPRARHCTRRRRAHGRRAATGHPRWDDGGAGEIVSGARRRWLMPRSASRSTFAPPARSRRRPTSSAWVSPATAACAPSSAALRPRAPRCGCSARSSAASRSLPPPAWHSASGTLQGDELRSILEAMPQLAQALAGELGMSVGELRKAGSEGRLTADQVFPALLRASEGVQRQLAGLRLYGLPEDAPAVLYGCPSPSAASRAYAGTGSNLRLTDPIPDYARRLADMGTNR